MGKTFWVLLAAIVAGCGLYGALSGTVGILYMPSWTWWFVCAYGVFAVFCEAVSE